MSSAAATLEKVEAKASQPQAQASFRPASHSIIFAIAAIALVIRLLPQLHHDVKFAYYLLDSHEFIQLNNGLVHGCGFSRYIDGRCTGMAEILRTPGYPVFLAAIPTQRAVLVVQSVMAAMLCAGIALVVAACWGTVPAIIAEIFLAIDIPSIVLANQFMSETLFTCLLALAVIPLLLLSPGKLSGGRMLATAALCGLAAGLAILTRPIGIVLPIIVAAPFALLRSERIGRRLAAVAIAAAIPAAAILGWSVRNYRAADYFGLSSVPAINLYYYRAATVEADVQRISLPAAQTQLSRQMPVAYPQIYDEHNQSRALEDKMDSAAERILIQYPFQTLAMTLYGSVYNALAPMRSALTAWLMIGEPEWRPPMITGAWMKSLLRKLMHSPLMAALITIQLLAAAALWIGVLLALIKSLRSPQAYRTWVLYLTFIGLIFIGLAGGGEACQRFRVPSLPLLAIVAGLGYAGWMKASPQNLTPQ